MKTCTKCGETKPLLEFYKNKSKKDGYTSQCQECIYGYYRTHGTNNYRPNKRSNYLKRTYDITADEYEQLFIDQDGKCAICKRPQIEFSRRFAVDHDHFTETVRGLLCINCNAFLGNINDNIEVVENMLKYLERFK